MAKSTISPQGLTIALTSGEPAGIGPNLCVMLAQQTQAYCLCVIGDTQLLQARAKLLNLPLKLIPFNQKTTKTHTTHTTHTTKASIENTAAGSLYIHHISVKNPVTPGQLDSANAPYVIQTLTEAAEGCMQQKYSAIVTAPVQKSVINDAGITFSGHTEFFAEQSQIPKVVMMLTTENLRVALVTTHLPLSQVPAAITPETLSASIRILHQGLASYYRIENPHILVTGLNPHAGEGGHLGHEEIKVITPTLNKLRKEGYQLTGPLPADTAFTHKVLKTADVVLSMYHDQGLPTLKYAGFGNAANVTLGLPYIRTSVDHGTALDKAAENTIDNSHINPGSLEYALNEAVKMADNQI